MATPIAYPSDVASAASGRERLLSLSGIAWAPLFLVGWFESASTTPHYSASDHEWIKWAHDNMWKGRISSFAILLACFLFLNFIGGIRESLGGAEKSQQLVRIAFAGAVTGMAGMAIAIVIIGAAATNGANANPVVSRAVTTGAAGPFLVAAAGFAAFLLAAGLLTLQSDALARWSGIVAAIGAACFLVTFLTVLGGTTDGSVFGYAFFPALLSLVVWTVATSVRQYRTST